MLTFILIAIGVFWLYCKYTAWCRKVHTNAVMNDDIKKNAEKIERKKSERQAIENELNGLTFTDKIPYVIIKHCLEQDYLYGIFDIVEENFERVCNDRFYDGKFNYDETALKIMGNIYKFLREASLYYNVYDLDTNQKFLLDKIYLYYFNLFNVY